MKQFNQFLISGRLGHNAELKFVGGSVKAKFSLAINRFDRRKKKEITHWVNIEAWRRKEDASEFDILQKGRMVAVLGYLEPDEYSRNGTDISVLIYHATKWKIISEDDAFQPIKIP